tara:strand:- start:256 stop:456 length:201 start_codon:yes stop_codon:yes gene_type:complete
MSMSLDDKLCEATYVRLEMAAKLCEAYRKADEDWPNVVMTDVLLAMLGASIEEAQGHFMERFPKSD